jgi:hypothetical protein
MALASGFAFALILAGPAVGGADSEQGATSPPTFSDLDGNMDGYLGKEEARERTGLVDQWRDVDRNLDDLIDRAEFAAFEVEEASQPPSLQQGAPASEGGGSGAPQSD